MYTDKITLQCVKYNLKYELPRSWDSLMLKQMCPVCQQEETEKWQGRFDQMSDHRDVLLRAIDIKLNVESEEIL